MTNKNVWKLSSNSFLKTLGSRLVVRVKVPFAGSCIRLNARVRFATNNFKHSMFVAICVVLYMSVCILPSVHFMMFTYYILCRDLILYHPSFYISKWEGGGI